MARRTSRSAEEAPAPKRAGARRKAAPRAGAGRRRGGASSAAQGRRRFPDISPRAYEHPADRAALVALRAVPGFDLLLRKLLGVIGDRSLRLAYLASSVRVNERQFPDVHARFAEACAVLDVAPMPELFVAQTPFVNAGAIGVDRPFIVINSGALGLLTPEELEVVLGHELGHVLSGHALYKTMLAILLRASLLFLSLPFGGAALLAITAALLEWDRKSELSADRAGLLVVQDEALALRVEMKLAGGGRTDQMSVDELLVQAAEYRSSGSLVDSVMKLTSLMGQTHPFPVLRLAELKEWAAAGDYERVLKGDYPRRSGDSSTSVIDELKRSSRAYGEDFAASQDPLASFVMEIGKQFKAAGDGLASWFRDDDPGGAAGPTA